MNGHWRVVPSHQASRTSSGSVDRLAPAEVHPGSPPRSIQARAQVIGPGRLSPANVPPGIGK